MKSRITIALPLVLFTIFVTLSSWQPGPQTGGDPQDTTKQGKKKSTRYSKKTVITFDENGRPYEEIIEDFEGDEALREQLRDGFDFDFDLEMPDMPDFEYMMPHLPDNFHVDQNFWPDSLDDFKFRFNEGDFERFGEEMEALIEQKFEAWRPEFEAHMRAMENPFNNMDMSFHLRLNNMNRQLKDQLNHVDDTLERELGDLDINLRELDERLRNLDVNLKTMDFQLKAFEEAAREELITDGYLQPSEPIESMEWTDDTLKFNGTVVKPEHVEKYKALKEKHIKQQWRRGRPE
jgi:hypothetical protein